MLCRGWCVEVNDQMKDISLNVRKILDTTEEELDFIINYDIKYSMGQDTSENKDEG